MSSPEIPRSLAEFSRGVENIPNFPCPSCKNERLTLVDDYGDWQYGCESCGEYFDLSELKRLNHNTNNKDND